MATIFIFFITNTGYCQSEKMPPVFSTGMQKDSATIKINNAGSGADSIKTDTAAIVSDTGKAASDTSKRRQLERSLGIKISKDALPSIVKATSEDSAVADMQHNLFHLYGNAQVNYEDLQLNAGKITYAQGNNIVSAVPYDERKDTGASKQTFSQGKEKFTYDSLQYNFKSKRAIVRNVHSQYGEGYMYSEQVKRNPDQTIFGAHSIYTTCALDTPHFGIVADRIKVIPGKVIVSGPANLYIEGVPTPLWLPFAIFPVSEKQKSGFIIPTYTIEEARGLGLLNGGYYLYLNDHVDFLTEANVFTKGSYGFSEVSNYSDIYHYKGTFSLSYAYNKTGQPFESGSSIAKDFMINWSHQSDAKAIPGQSFNASVELGSSSFYSNTSNISDQILQNQRESNITYSKNWQGTPFGLTISALGNQNTLNKQTNVTLPEIDFHVTQINPFQKKNRIGKQRWYDKITASYTVDGLNKTTFYDSTFNFAHILSNSYQMGVHHTVPISASYTIFRYVNMSFSVNYDEYWVNQELLQNYNTLTNVIDTTTKQGFFASRDFNAGVNFSTRIYGMKMFKHGTLRGIRHVLTPSVGLTYHPDFGSAPFNYYYRTHLDTPILPSNYTYQTLYPNSVVGYPPLGRAALVTFGVNNNVQIKVRSDKDTVTGFKNVTLIDALGATVSYNPAADSFKWSNIGLNFRTNILDKINISSAASFNPYATDFNTGRELPQTMEQLGFGLAQFSSATFSLGSNFHSKPIGNTPNPSNSEEYGRVMRNAGYNNYTDFNIPWSINFSYSFSANNTYSTFSRRDTIVLSQTLTLQGELQITQRWKLNVSSGYNFTFNQLTLTSIDVYRDLHCWAMHLQTIPFGPRKSFTFTLNVKSAILQDLKLTKRRDFRDSPD